MDCHGRLEDAKSGREKVTVKISIPFGAAVHRAHLCTVTARCCSRQAQQRFAAQRRTGSEEPCGELCVCVTSAYQMLARTTSRQTGNKLFGLSDIFMIKFDKTPCSGDLSATSTRWRRAFDCRHHLMVNSCQDPCCEGLR